MEATTETATFTVTEFTREGLVQGIRYRGLNKETALKLYWKLDEKGKPRMAYEEPKREGGLFLCSKGLEQWN